MKSKITLKELAKLLNVSVSTVSKSLNDSPEISPKTIERVKELARLHNYRPNPTAVNLKRNRTGNIAVIVPNIANSFFAKVLGGVETEARNLGFQVITYISNESLKLEQQITELVSNGIVDGLLISVSEETQKMQDYSHLKQLVEYEIPVVLFDRIDVDMELDKVGVNDKGSTYDAVQFLYSKNIKKIGLVCALGDIGLGEERIEGFTRASNELGLTIDPGFVVVSPETEKVTQQLEELLKKKEIEALIGLDYMSTLLTSRVIQENGFKIPEDIKLIGYVNEDFASFLWPSISYVDQHPKKMGETAALQLIKRIQNPKDNYTHTSKVIIKTELKHLDSTRF